MTKIINFLKKHSYIIFLIFMISIPGFCFSFSELVFVSVETKYVDVYHIIYSIFLSPISSFIAFLFIYLFPTCFFNIVLFLFFKFITKNRFIFLSPILWGGSALYTLLSNKEYIGSTFSKEIKNGAIRKMVTTTNNGVLTQSGLNEFYSHVGVCILCGFLFWFFYDFYLKNKDKYPPKKPEIDYIKLYEPESRWKHLTRWL